MGYLPEETIYRLKFESRPGLEVDTKSVSTGTLMNLTRLASHADGKSLEESMGIVDMLFTGFAEALVGWNLQMRKGGEVVDVPPTFEGMKTQSPKLVLEIITAWMQEVAGVSVPLPEGSNSGEPFPEVSIPMETR